MITVTLDEIEQYRTVLESNATALQALDMIADCEGDLEDAAIALALHTGQEPDQSEQWLDGLAKRWRSYLCQAAMKAKLSDGSLADVINTFAQDTSIPDILAIPVVLYTLKTGVESFCKPLEELL